MEKGKNIFCSDDIPAIQIECRDVPARNTPMNMKIGVVDNNLAIQFNPPGTTIIIPKAAALSMGQLIIQEALKL